VSLPRRLEPEWLDHLPAEDAGDALRLDCQQARSDEHDLGSIIVNSPDADGTPPSDEAIAGQMPAD
jgi:hypothetical protein